MARIRLVLALMVVAIVAAGCTSSDGDEAVAATLSAATSPDRDGATP